MRRDKQIPIESIVDTPLMIEPRRLHQLLSSSDPQGFLNFGFDEEDGDPTPSRVSIVPVRYTLFHRLDYTSGGYWSIRDKFDAALASDSEAVIIDIDSPGGDVAGLFELVEHMRDARKGVDKAVVAVSNEAAFSAAYAIATVADRIVLNSETAGVGSVGVIAVHMEMSGRDAAEGFVYNAIYSGERKNDFSRHEPLSDTARQIMQDRVDTIRSMFVASVAEGRPKLTQKAIFDTEAATYSGKAALEVGFADDVMSLEDLVESFNNATVQVPVPGATGVHMDNENGTGNEPEATPSNTPEPQGSGTVVQLDAARSEGHQAGVEAERARVAELGDLCTLAGRSDLLAGYISENTSVADARKQLIDAHSNDNGETVVTRVPNDPEVASTPTVDVAGIYAKRANQIEAMRNNTAAQYSARRN